MSKKLNSLIALCKHKLKSEEANYKITLECDYLLRNIEAHKKENDDLIKELFTLWEDLAKCGEIQIGKRFTYNYERIKKLINE